MNFGRADSPGAFGASPFIHAASECFVPVRSRQIEGSYTEALSCRRRRWVWRGSSVQLGGETGPSFSFSTEDSSVKHSCLFCMGDASEPDHLLRCDGRQGALDERAAKWPSFANVRATDPDTSHSAAAPDRAIDRERALKALRQAGDNGLTDFELGELIGRQQTSAGKRRGELRDAGRVRNSGRRRPAPSGHGAIVWVAMELS